MLSHGFLVTDTRNCACLQQAMRGHAMSEEPNGKLANRRQAIVAFVIACIVAWAVEIAAEHAFEDKGKMAGSLFSLGGIYQQVITSGPRKPIQKFTVLVDARADNDKYYPSLSNGVLNACERRTPLAALIRAIARARPSVIVLDYSFNEKQCAAEDGHTADLKAAIGVVSESVPIVYGRRNAPDRTLEPSLAFPVTRRAMLQQGMINFDPDTRRLPLNWAIHTTPPSTNKEAWTWFPTLALSAARSQNAQLEKKYVRLANFLHIAEDAGPDGGQQAVHPFVSFLQPAQMTLYAAGEVLCGANYTSALAGTESTPCTLSDEIPNTLRGKIVVVGESGPADAHDSVIGLVPGFILQANYIEALLDERYYKPAPPWIDFAFGLVIFIALTAASEVENGVRMIALCAATLAVAYVSIYFAIMHLGYYTNPVAVSVFALVITLGHRIRHWVKPLASKFFTLTLRRPS